MGYSDTIEGCAVNNVVINLKKRMTNVAEIVDLLIEDLEEMIT